MADVLELTQNPKERDIPKRDYSVQDDGPTKEFRIKLRNICEKIIANEPNLCGSGKEGGDLDFAEGAAKAANVALGTVNEYDFKDNLISALEKFS